MEKRDFKGVWIPKQIWLDTDLTWMEKLLLVEIESLDNENGCFASNKYFAEFFQVSKPRITQIIKSLEKKGRLKVYLQKEGKRVIKRTIKVVNIFTRGGKYSKQGGKNTKQGVVNILKDNNTTVNNTINKECVNTQNTPPQEPDEIERPTQDDPIITVTDHKEKRKKVAAKKEKFTPPTPEQIYEAMIEYEPKKIKNIQLYPDFQQMFDFGMLANEFHNHYTANDWKVGRNKMKDYTATARNWVLNRFSNWIERQKPNASNYDNANNREERYGAAKVSDIKQALFELDQEKRAGVFF